MGCQNLWMVEQKVTVQNHLHIQAAIEDLQARLAEVRETEDGLRQEANQVAMQNPAQLVLQSSNT
jgi:hypothetical protein